MRFDRLIDQLVGQSIDWSVGWLIEMLVLRSFLFEVQRHSSVNKMNVENLAMVMGINLLKPQVEDPVSVMKGEVTPGLHNVLHPP